VGAFSASTAPARIALTARAVTAANVPDILQLEPLGPPWPADPGARAVSPAPCNAIATTGLAPATRD